MANKSAHRRRCTAQFGSRRALATACVSHRTANSRSVSPKASSAVFRFLRASHRLPQSSHFFTSLAGTLLTYKWLPQPTITLGARKSEGFAVVD